MTECRICYQDVQTQLITPCKCKGSIQKVHRECLERWITLSSNLEDKIRCRICNEKYQYQVDVKSECKKLTGYSILFLTFISSCILFNFLIINVGKIIIFLSEDDIYLFSYNFRGNDKLDIVYFYVVYLLICLAGMYTISRLNIPILFILINFNFQTGCMIFFISGLIYLFYLFYKGLISLKNFHDYILTEFQDQQRIKDLEYF
jgi:hypothetical protein